MEPREKLDRNAYEAEIGDDAEHYRSELSVEQIAPTYSTASEAFLLVRADAHAEVEALISGLEARLSGFFHLRHGRELASSWRGSDGAVLVTPSDERLLIRLAHDSDRTYAGYENIYRTIRALAPHVEDGRFVISEDYDRWIDCYRIEAGELTFERGYADSEYRSDKHDYLLREGQLHADDQVWVRYCARSLASSAHYEIDRAELPTLTAPEQKTHRAHARALLERAASLDAEEPTLCAQMGRLLALEGRAAEADPWFERHAAVISHPPTLFVAALTALRAGEFTRAQGWLERLRAAAPTHQAATQLLAVVAGRGGDQARARAHALDAWHLNLAAHAAGQRLAEHAEELHRAGLHEELLEVYLAHATPTNEGEREALAVELLRWAELLRIKVCHQINTERSQQQAEALYRRALDLHPLEGRIHAARALFLRQAKLEGEREALEAALAVNPDNVEALGRLGTMALEAGQRVAAIDLLGRAVDHSLAAGAGGYRRGQLASYLLQALVEEGNRLLEAGEPESLRAADALFERADTFGCKLGDPAHRWHGALLRRCAAHTLLGAHAQALVFAEQALALAPDSVHARSELASCLHNLGRDDDALAACARAAALEEDYWHVPYVHACVLAGTGAELDEIIALLEQAIALDEPCRGRLAADPDFARIRAEPSFMALLSPTPVV